MNNLRDVTIDEGVVLKSRSFNAAPIVAKLPQLHIKQKGDLIHVLSGRSTAGLQFSRLSGGREDQFGGGRKIATLISRDARLIAEEIMEYLEPYKTPTGQYRINAQVFNRICIEWGLNKLSSF